MRTTSTGSEGTQACSAELSTCLSQLLLLVSGHTLTHADLCTVTATAAIAIATAIIAIAICIQATSITTSTESTTSITYA
jgi:hypothetical protein